MKTMTGNEPQAAGSFARHAAVILLATAALLMVPLVAMQFTREVNWTLFDFVVAGALLAGTGLAYELVARQLRTKQQCMIAAAVLLLALMTAWAELAVGIFH